MPISTANVTTTNSAVYTSVGDTAVTFLSLANYSGGNVTANLYVVPSGNTAANTNIVLTSIEILSQDTYQLYAASEKLLLSNGDAIWVDASANSAVATVTSYTSV